MLWRYGSEPAERPYTIEPVHGTVTWLSVRAACVAAGLIRGATLEHPGERLVEAASEAFGQDITRFLSAAQAVGCTRQAVEEAARRLDNVHVCFGLPAPCSNEGLLVCTDLALTVAALSRRIGSVILRDRPPLLTWDQLFSTGAAIAEPIGGAAPASLALREQLQLPELPPPIAYDGRVRRKPRTLIVRTGSNQ